MDKNLRGVPKDLPGLNRVNGPGVDVPFFEVLVRSGSHFSNLLQLSTLGSLKCGFGLL